MLQFAKEHMASIEGVSIYPIIALLLFSGFFITLIWRVYSLKKKHVDYLKNIPLDD